MRFGQGIGGESQSVGLVIRERTFVAGGGEDGMEVNLESDEWSSGRGD